MPARPVAPASRTLPDQPNLRQLKTQAKELLRAYRNGEADAVAEVSRYEREPGPQLSLVDMQRVLARAYGSAGWADVDAMVYASGSPMDQAYGARDEQMKALLRRHGALTRVEIIGLNRDTAAAREAAAAPENASTDRTDATPMEQLLWAGACGGDPEIVALCLPYIDRPLDDPWWSNMLEQPLRIWNHGPNRHFLDLDRSTYARCLEVMLEHGVGPDVTDHHGYTALQHLAQAGAAWGQQVITETERVEFGRVLIDAGASLTVRDPILRSTPLGWACRWGRRELAELLLERGAPANEPDAESWATPLVWAEKMGHPDVAEVLRDRGAAA